MQKITGYCNKKPVNDSNSEGAENDGTGSNMTRKILLGKVKRRGALLYVVFFCEVIKVIGGRVEAASGRTTLVELQQSDLSLGWCWCAL